MPTNNQVNLENVPQKQSIRTSSLIIENKCSSLLKRFTNVLFCYFLPKLILVFSQDLDNCLYTHGFIPNSISSTCISKTTCVENLSSILTHKISTVLSSTFTSQHEFALQLSTCLALPKSTPLPMAVENGREPCPQCGDIWVSI